MWPLSLLLRTDSGLDLEIGALATCRTPTPGDASKVNVSVAGNGVDEATEHARLGVGYGIALREPGLVVVQPTASAGRFDQPTGV